MMKLFVGFVEVVVEVVEKSEIDQGYIENVVAVVVKQSRLIQRFAPMMVFVENVGFAPVFASFQRLR
jgi:hypothetical protein